MRKPRPRERQPQRGAICANCQRLVMFLKLNSAGDVVAVFTESVIEGQEFYNRRDGHVRHDAVCKKLEIRSRSGGVV
jgi:hypothetical protein